MIVNPDPSKYTVHSTDQGLTWHVIPPVWDVYASVCGPFQRWQDARDFTNAHVLLNRFRPGSVTEEKFHVDTA